MNLPPVDHSGLSQEALDEVTRFWDDFKREMESGSMPNAQLGAWLREHLSPKPKRTPFESFKYRVKASGIELLQVMSGLTAIGIGFKLWEGSGVIISIAGAALGAAGIKVIQWSKSP